MPGSDLKFSYEGANSISFQISEESDAGPAGQARLASAPGFKGSVQPHICALPLSLSRPEEKGGRPAVNGRAFRFPLAEQAQELVLTLPAMRSKMESERREILVKLSTRLIEAGFSLNKAATFLEVPASQLCTWRKKYNQGGVQALRPIYGRLSKKHPSGATGCTIGFTLKP